MATPQASEGRSIATKIVALAVVAALVVASVLATFGYWAETTAAKRGVDAKLLALVSSADALVADDIHARAASGALDEAAYAPIAARLTAVADEAGVEYLYTCVRRDGVVYVETTSQSRGERAEGQKPDLMKVYERVPPEAVATLDDGVTRYASYEDEYGRFRSAFRAVDTPNGRVVVAADVRLDDLHAIARKNVLFQLGIALAVLVPVALVALVVGRRIARPIVELAQGVRAFSDSDFSNDERSVAAISRIANDERDETRTLATAMLEMRRELARHIDELTTITAERERITSQLQLARDIQRGLLPQRAPDAAGYDIAGWSEAADETGGDFYDWMTTPQGQIVLVLADVTGHGVGPSLMAAVCRAYARATLAEESPLEPLVDRLNRLVHGDVRSGQFVTFFAGVLDPTAATVRILSAAHGPILVYRAREHRVEESPTHGLPLGVVEELEPEPGTTLALEPGDVLLVVSDGFFEWAGASGEQFGQARLEAALLAAATSSAAEIIESVRQAVYRHTTGTVQPDDMTAIAVKRLG
jgi:serine phosphatase RsbU (regulator of sigma subunit)